MDCTWKANWEETKENFQRWWNHEGLVIGGWYGLPASSPKNKIDKPGIPSSLKEQYLNADYRAKSNHYRIANSIFPLDILPIAETNIAPGALALFLGGEAEFSDNVVWLQSSDKLQIKPKDWPELRIDKNNCHWHKQLEILKKSRELSKGKYIVGLTDLVQNIDTLDTLRGTNNLMMDFLDRPEWVKQKVEEITIAWFEAFDKCYDIIKLDDGSMAVDCFRKFASGKTAMLQCDAAGMISEDMFNEFVLSSIKKQCEFLDYSIYHVDGPDALRHLDSLLEIEELDAIEWTPGPQVPQGGDPQWYDLYKRILSAGKSVQAVDVKVEEVFPLLENIGDKGVYVISNISSEKDVEFISKGIGK